jgi:hypothetical protein
MQLPKTMTRSTFRLRTLAVAQALVLLVSLGAPFAGVALASIGGVVIGAQTPDPVIAGSDATYTITTTMDSSTGTTQITTVSGLPAGATIGSDCAVSASDGTTYRNLLTIHTAGTTPGGTSATITPTVTAYSGAACSGAVSATDASHTASLVFAPKIATTTTITSDTPDPSTAGSAYTVTATVDRSSGTDAITGTMTISDGTASCVDTDATGGTSSPVTYSCLLTSTTVGAKTLTASYPGNPSLSASSGTAPHTVVAVAATKLAITSVNGGVSPTVGTAFSVVVQSQDASGNPANVDSTTGVSLSRSTGTGTLGGTTTGSIANGASSVTISGVTYSVAETGVILTATRTSGMSLTAGPSAAFTVVGTFTKLQLLVPGETAAPGTATGKTGTPTAQTAGIAFTVTVKAVDANWNVVSSVHTVGITSSDANATLPANALLAAGTATFSVTFKTAGNRTVTATDITDSAKTANTSPSITVNAGTFSKLQLLVPGETAAPGTASGKTGTPSTEGAGAAFSVTVNAVDANWNVATSTHTVGITSTDAAATLPANAALVAGTKTFSVTLNTVGSKTVTATDISDGTKTASTSAAITVVSPAAIQLVRSTGMVTYGGSVGFSIQFASLGGTRTFVLEHTYVGSAWTTIATLTTNASGFSSFSYAPTRTGYYRARFAGTADLGAANSAVILVGVRQTITLAPTHAGVLTIAKGRSIAFRSTVRPLRPDLLASRVTFRFYQKVAGAWVLKYERHVAADSVGTARTTFRFGVRGSWYVMAFADRTLTNAVSRFSQREVFLVR